MYSILLGFRVKTYRFLLFSFLLSCSSSEAIRDAKELWYHDPDKNMHFGSYRKGLNGIERNNGKPKKPLLEDDSRNSADKKLIVPKEQNIELLKRVTISTNGKVPLKDILFELAKTTNINIQAEDSVRTFTAAINIKDRPLMDVLDIICDAGHFTYSKQNGVIVLKPDKPYLENYNMGFLNIIRSSSSEKKLNTAIETGLSQNGSKMNISSEGVDTFWEDLENGIYNILEKHEKDAFYVTKKEDDEKVRRLNAESNSIESAIQNFQINNNKSEEKGGKEFDKVIDNSTLEKFRKEQKVNVSEKNSESALFNPKKLFAINKQAGVMNIFATSKTHRIINTYIKEIRRKVMAQVLIEVKFMEVRLNNDFSAGINWDLSQIIPMARDAILGATSPGSIFFGSLGDSRGSMISAVNFLKTFGSTKTLASPRINAMNNQQSVLSIVDNKVFFDVDISVAQPGVTAGGTVYAPQTISVKTTPKTVPVGIVLVLQPSIDLDRREIMMSLKPTISRVTSTTNDPGVDFIVAKENISSASKIENKIPNISTRELDAVVKIKDGDVMVIGGFTDQQKTVKHKGLPFFGSIPGLGWLFKTKTTIDSVIETVILIKATITEEANADEYDKYMYKKYFDDPRPFFS